MRKIVLTMLLMALISLCGCSQDSGTSSGTSETPAEAVRAIIQLYQAWDFDSLVRTRYAEIHKIENEKQMQALIDRFESRFADENRLDQAVRQYEALLTMSPEFSPDGKTVLFDLKERGFVKLSRLPDGRWGFHL